MANTDTHIHTHYSYTNWNKLYELLLTIATQQVPPLHPGTSFRKWYVSNALKLEVSISLRDSTTSKRLVASHASPFHHLFTIF